MPATGPCVGAYKLGTSNRCTHGPDAAPEGVNVKLDVAAIRLLPLAPLPKVQCDGDGISGKRVQVIYARSSDQPNRYGTYLNSIRQWAAESDEIYRDSAAETAGERHIRFVHNSSCVLTVPHVVMSATGDDSFTNTQVELAAQGYNLATRKYMIFVDANVYCGIGNIKNDDQPGAANLNNGGPSYGRTDAGCWGGTTPAHELMHNIGGVQLSAPHSSGGWHCTDEWDLECYSDSPYYPTMSYLCPDVEPQPALRLRPRRLLPRRLGRRLPGHALEQRQQPVPGHAQAARLGLRLGEPADGGELHAEHDLPAELDRRAEHDQRVSGSATTRSSSRTSASTTAAPST